MRRAWPSLVALAAVILLSSWASAVETTATTSEKKARSELGGSISFEAVYRPGWFDEIFSRSATTPTSQSEGFINGMFSFNATIMPSQSVTLFLELRTAPDAYRDESHRVGDNNNIPQFREAWIKVEDLFGKWTEGRTVILQAGLLGKDFRYELRNLGRDAFFMDPANSENPFSGLPNLPEHAGGDATVIDPAPIMNENTFLGGNPWINSITGMAKQSEAGGLKLTLTPHRNAHVDLGAFIMMEGGINDVELGTNIFFFNFDFEFDLQGEPTGLQKEVTFEDTSVFNIMITGIQGR
ncbi:MAG: hypothetical protein ACYTHM_11030, partial [Planctomycetota bacterium]